MHDDAVTDDELIEGDPAPPRPPAAEPVVVPRWIQLVMLPIGVLALWALARAAGAVLLIFIAAGIVALILNPLVTFFQRGLRIRGLAVAAVYVGFFGFLGTAGYLAANPIADQAQSFQHDVPGIIDDANANLAQLQNWLDDKGINLKVKKQGETALQTLQDKVVGGTSNVVSFGSSLVKTIVTAGFGLILVFILSIYMLIYGERIGGVVRTVMPPGDGTPEDDFPTRVQRAVAGYVRGQLLFSVAMGTGAGLGLYLFGVLGIFPDGKTYAFAFGIFFGLMELIPFVGPFLGALPPILVALFQDPVTALWVGLLFLGLQQIEGHIVAPNVFGHTLRINPLFVIFSLLVGGEIAGLVGALLSLPIAAVIRETVVYLRRHLVLEPWSVTAPEPLTARPRHSLPATEAKEEREEVPSQT
jgi:predicted PurR-regulated permease PerM